MSSLMPNTQRIDVFSIKFPSILLTAHADYNMHRCTPSWPAGWPSWLAGQLAPGPAGQPRPDGSGRWLGGVLWGYCGEVLWGNFSAHFSGRTLGFVGRSGQFLWRFLHFDRLAGASFPFAPNLLFRDSRSLRQPPRGYGWTRLIFLRLLGARIVQFEAKNKDFRRDFQ